MSLLRNARHELFSGLFVKTGNARQSYIESGFSESTADAGASRLLKHPKVSARIVEIRGNIVKKAERVVKVVEEKLGIDKAWVIAELIEVVQMAKQAKQVKDKDGESIGEYQQNLSAANKALELIGKELKMFVERSEILHGSVLDNLEHEQLKELENQLRAAITFNKSGLEDTERVTH